MREAAPATPTTEETPERGIVCSSSDSPSGIRRVVLRGARDRTPCARLRSIAGRAEDARVVENDIEALFATRAYADVVVAREEDEHGAALVFEVEERPRIRAVSLDGLGSDAAKTALEGFDLETPERVDPAWLRSVELRVTEALVDAGFGSATAQASVQRRADDASVRVVIDEGRQTLLTRLRIDGLRVADEKPLRGKLYMRVGAPAPPDLIERDQLVISMQLYDLGLLDCNVEKRTVVSDDGTGIDVSFRVKEGAVHHLRKVAIVGDVQLDAKTYAPVLATLKPGAAFSRSAVADVAAKLAALHTEAKKPADVEPKIDVAPGGTDVSVTFEITPR